MRASAVGVSLGFSKRVQKKVGELEQLELTAYMREPHFTARSILNGPTKIFFIANVTRRFALLQDDKRHFLVWLCLR
jgi:hypothetical protein